MPTLLRQLRWYIVLRLVAVLAAVLPYGLSLLLNGPAQVGPESAVPAPPESGAVDPKVALLLLFLTCVATLIYIALLRVLRDRPKVQAYIQFFGDLLLVTGMVYSLGGIQSPFSLLYLVVIAVASALLRKRAGIAVASGANVLYAGLVLALYYRTHGTDVLRVSYLLAVHCVGFYAVALLTSYLARSAHRAELELVEKSGHLADLQVMHRDIVQSLNSGLITTDLAGFVTLVNLAGLAILGQPEDELVGRPIQASGLFSAPQWEKLTATASRQNGQLRSEVEVERADGTAFIGFSISLLTEANGRQGGYIVIFQDLTQWQRLREELRLKDRMAAVGEMAAGLAHEIGNPLAAISGSVQMLAGSGGNEASQRRLVEILLKESQRLDRTVKGFLRFARPRERSIVPFDIARLLAENFELLRNSEEVSPQHNLEIDLDPPSVHLLGDPDQVTQIFWNLARNSLRAMPEGGTLCVLGRLTPEVYQFRVLDTGRGMSEEQRANLFHPFRSFFDGGTGIGMAIVYRIVQEHGGRLHVDSRPGGGTTISVELPREDAAAAHAAMEPALPATSELP